MSNHRESLAVAICSNTSVGNARRLWTGAAWLLLSGLLFTGPALAHAQDPVTPSDLWSRWSLDPLVTVPLGLAVFLYAGGIARMRARLRRPPAAFRASHAAAFSLGIASLVLALLSPLEAATGTLLAAHMVQHVLLVTVAPLLLVLGRPEIAWVWGLPGPWRRSLGRSIGWRRFFSGMRMLARPVPAALIHAAALWVWHAPALFDAALEQDWLHWLEHVSFFGTALLFWRGIVSGASRRETAAPAVAACLITVVQGGLLGALLTFASRPLYATSEAATAAWGVSPLEDQQIAGIIMWVPTGAFYMIAGLAAALQLLTPPGNSTAKPSVAASGP